MELYKEDSVEIMVIYLLKSSELIIESLVIRNSVIAEIETANKLYAHWLI